MMAPRSFFPLFFPKLRGIYPDFLFAALSENQLNKHYGENNRREIRYAISDRNHKRIIRYGFASGGKRGSTGYRTAKNPQKQRGINDEIRDIYEVFLDSVCLEDNLLSYLIDILKRGAQDEFQTLSHAAARTLLDMDEFLLWLGNKEAFAGPDERACAAIMDGCLNRLMQEGQRELAAALLSGDETTFKLFRTQAPELVHLPDATYEWYAQNYLDRYYPVRFILRMNGVVFPELTQKEE